MADVFGWEWTEGRFDTICFAAWLHHVPEGCFDDFWSRIDRWLAPDGLVLFDFAVADGPAAVASAPPVAPTESYAAYHDPERAVSVRDLGGRRWRVIHELWDPRELTARLGRLGWELRIEMEDPGGFHWASARRTAGPPASVRRDG
jgi:SAM-dependent methyltransferase